MQHLRALSLAGLLLAIASPASFASEADRIQLLEQQLSQQKSMLEQQQRMLEKMTMELERLKAGRVDLITGAVTAIDGPTATAAGNDNLAESSVESTPGPKTSHQLSANIYGFAQADAIYDFKRVDPNWDDTLRVTTIPTTGGTYGGNGDVVFGVRQSRLGIAGNYGPDVSFKVEAELFGVGGDEGQTTPRLRHAWATYKNIGMGQTWSNFMDIDIFPNTVDYWGPTGMVFYRNQQVRYSFAMGEDEFSISLEDPDTALTVGRFRDTNACDLPNSPPDCDSVGSGAADLFQSYNDLPDLALRYRNNGDFGHFQLAGIVRKLGYERLDTGQKDHEVGWGINTSAGLKTWGKDKIKVQLVYGEGIGNYMNDGGIDIAPDSTDINTAEADPVGLLGISAYYDHYWNERWSTSIGWSMTDLDTEDGQLPSEFKRGQIAQINLLHYPNDHVLMGTEFNWGQREDIDGNRGSDYRIQFTLKVNFDSGNIMQAR